MGQPDEKPALVAVGAVVARLDRDGGGGIVSADMTDEATVAAVLRDCVSARGRIGAPCKASGADLAAEGGTSARQARSSGAILRH